MDYINSKCFITQGKFNLGKIYISGVDKLAEPVEDNVKYFVIT